MKNRETPILFYIAMYVFFAGVYLMFSHPRLTVEALILDFWRVYVYGAAAIIIFVFIFRKI